MKRYVLECSRGLLQKTSHTLEGDATIGRDPQNTICLSEPQVSRRHARVGFDNGQWVLYDLGSLNGTYLNGKKIHRQPLRPGDLILIGQTTLTFLKRDEPDESVSLKETEEAFVGDVPQEIHEQIDLVRTFLDALPLGVAIINDKMEVRYCNQALISVAPPDVHHESSSLGVVIGCPFLMEGDPFCRLSQQCEDCALHSAAERLFGTGESTFGEEIPWHSEREPSSSYVRFSMIPLPYRLTGEPLAQLAWEDITSRKAAEVALRKAHDHLERRVKERTAKLRKAIEELRREIFVRKQAEEKLWYMSTHDVLTGLYNRAFFEEEMARLERGRQSVVSVVVVDVDGMKEINDNSGHTVGDEVLRRAAAVLINAFRAEDVVARIGGDEFAVLLPDTDAMAAREVLGRVESGVLANNIAHGGPLLRLSLGAETAQGSSSLIEVFKEADKKMYTAKPSRFKKVDACGYQESSRL